MSLIFALVLLQGGFESARVVWQLLVMSLTSINIIFNFESSLVLAQRVVPGKFDNTLADIRGPPCCLYGH